MWCCVKSSATCLWEPQPWKEIKHWGIHPNIQQILAILERCQDAFNASSHHDHVSGAQIYHIIIQSIIFQTFSFFSPLVFWHTFFFRCMFHLLNCDAMFTAFSTDNPIVSLGAWHSLRAFKNFSLTHYICCSSKLCHPQKQKRRAKDSASLSTDMQPVKFYVYRMVKSLTYWFFF